VAKAKACGWPFSFVHVLGEFAKVARLHDDASFAERCEVEAKTNSACESRRNAWDGQWYRRAYFDDGSPLGSTRNAECQIDSSRKAGRCCPGLEMPSARAWR